MLFAGEGGQSRLLHKRIWTNIMPRIGFAYEANRKTVFRGGYGLFFDSPSYARYNVSQPGFSRTTPITPSLNNGQTFVATMANPFPSGAPPAGGEAPRGYSPTTGSAWAIPFVDDVKAPYAHRFSIGFQRELPWDFVLDATYVGTPNAETSR